MSHEQSLLTFINNIKTNNVPFPKVQISTFGDLFITVCYDENDSNIMSNSASTGMDFDPSLSTLKAFTEYFERKTLQFGFHRKDSICLDGNSDGFASFPTCELDYQQKAKENALNEAIERYVWANWWDDINISYDLSELFFSKKYLNSKILDKMDSLVKRLAAIIQIDKIFQISPFIENSNKRPVILFLRTKEGGYISGGSCETSDSYDKAIIRAMSELIRHALGYKRFLTTNKKPESFYEKRLLYFASGQGGQLVDERLSKCGSRVIELPNLKIDSTIESIYDLITYTHRCLFEGQPPFVGGKMERLCL